MNGVRSLYLVERSVENLIELMLHKDEVRGLSRTWTCRRSGTLLEALLAAGVEVSSSCGGNGSCGTCLMKVTGVSLPERSEIESEMAADRGFDESERLTCQIDLDRVGVGTKIRISF